METKGKSITIYADDEFLTSLDRWTRKKQVNRSPAIRQIVIDFLEQGDAYAR